MSEIIVTVCAGASLAAFIFILALCRAAARGDER